MEIFTTYEFFGAIEEAKLSQTDRITYVQKTCNNFDPYRLSVLLEDLNEYLDSREQEFDYTEEEVEEKMKLYAGFEWELPTLKMPNADYYLKLSKGESVESINSETTYIDYPDLLSYWPILHLRQFKEKLEALVAQKYREQQEKTEAKDITTLDLSTSIGTEKIIYLEKLGIINFLRQQEPFKTSTNKLATAVSAITGITRSTAQSYLNPIVNPGADQKNNPLNSTAKVEAIKQTLTNLGFKPTK